MNYRQYQASNIQRQLEGKDPLPAIIDVVHSVMVPDRIMARDEIIRKVSSETGIDIDDDISKTVSISLAELKKQRKVTHVNHGLWQWRG